MTNIPANFEFVEEYKLLHVLEFNSTRKRMSVVVKRIFNGVESEDAWVLTKGADSVIEKLLNKGYTEPGKKKDIKNKTWDDLEEYGKTGLRTLLLADRRIPKHTFDLWNEKYEHACNIIEGREERMEELQAEIEVDLEIVGATAIEDQLQDKVGETISSLMDAGIKVWVLTGDKIETAVNIGYSCKLLDDNLFQLRIDGLTIEEVQKSIEKAKKNLENPVDSDEEDEEEMQGHNSLKKINEE